MTHPDTAALTKTVDSLRAQLADTATERDKFQDALRMANRTSRRLRSERDLLGRQQQALLDLCAEVERDGANCVLTPQIYQVLLQDPADMLELAGATAKANPASRGLADDHTADVSMNAPLGHPTAGGDGIIPPIPHGQAETKCRRCAHTFDPSDIRFDGQARFSETPWCRGCVDRCHESSDGFHTCRICEPSTSDAPEQPMQLQPDGTYEPQPAPVRTMCVCELPLGHDGECCL